MKFLTYHHAGPELTIYPLVCLHVGVENCAEDFIREHVARIAADPNGIAVYMGDGGECSIRASKGDLFSQHLSPGDQLDYAASLLKPIAGKVLFGIRGNHGNRIYKETGVDWDQELCMRLTIAASEVARKSSQRMPRNCVPYLGQAAFARFEVGVKDTTHRVVKYDTYFHHGAGGGITMGGKVNSAMKVQPQVDADAFFTAHSHICNENPVSSIAYLPPNAQHISWKTRYSYICGAAYDSRRGYAEERMYSPILPAYLAVTFNGRDNRRTTDANNRGVNKHLSCKIWNMDPNTHLGDPTRR